MEEITIKIPEEVADVLTLFVDTLQADRIEATREEIASVMLVDWAARQSAEISCFGDRSVKVYPLRPERIGKSDRCRLDTYLLFDFLKSDYMMAFLAEIDPSKKETIKKTLQERYELKMKEQASVDEADKIDWSSAKLASSHANNLKWAKFGWTKDNWESSPLPAHPVCRNVYKLR